VSKIEGTSQKIKQCGIIAIIRGDFSVDEMLRICTALLAGYLLHPLDFLGF
jgi:hypothetical protein